MRFGVIGAASNRNLKVLRITGATHPLREGLNITPSLVLGHALDLASGFPDGADRQAGDVAADRREHRPADAHAAAGRHGKGLLDHLTVLATSKVLDLLGVAAGVGPDGGE
ncbi:hypothetical protein PG984_003639 [Apiospora sp. TS-2023a]